MASTKVYFIAFATIRMGNEEQIYRTYYGWTEKSYPSTMQIKKEIANAQGQPVPQVGILSISLITEEQLYDARAESDDTMIVI